MTQTLPVFLATTRGGWKQLGWGSWPKRGAWREEEARAEGQSALRGRRSEPGRATRGSYWTQWVQMRVVCSITRSVKGGRIWGQCFSKCMDFLGPEGLQERPMVPCACLVPCACWTITLRGRQGRYHRYLIAVGNNDQQED